MVTNALVEVKIQEGKTLLSELDQKTNYKCKIAFWSFLEDESRWVLMLGITRLTDVSKRKVLLDAFEIIRQKNLSLGLYEISVLPDTSEYFSVFKNLISTEFEILEISFSDNYYNGKRLPDAIIYRLVKS